MTPLALCGIFLLLGLCLLVSGDMLRRDGGGVYIESVTLRNGDRGTLYLPREREDAAYIPAYEGGEDTAAPGRYPAALILTGGLDGGASLAVELSRRNVTVLFVRGDVDSAEAWRWLLLQDFTDPRAVGLFAGGDRAREALDLASSLAGTDGECAAVVLLGDESVLAAAVEHPGRNLMVLTGKKPDPDTAAAFFGGEAGAEWGFSGFFDRGTARASEALGGIPAFSRRDVMTRIMDWQGSALGRASRLEDADLIYGRILFCRAAAPVCLALGLATWLCRRKIQGES